MREFCSCLLGNEAPVHKGFGEEGMRGLARLFGQWVPVLVPHLLAFTTFEGVRPSTPYALEGEVCSRMGAKISGLPGRPGLTTHSHEPCLPHLGRLERDCHKVRQVPHWSATLVQAQPDMFQAVLSQNSTVLL